jgi:hypothetical protein
MRTKIMNITTTRSETLEDQNQEHHNDEEHNKVKTKIKNIMMTTITTKHARMKIKNITPTNNKAKYNKI